LHKVFRAKRHGIQEWRIQLTSAIAKPILSAIHENCKVLDPLRLRLTCIIRVPMYGSVHVAPDSCLVESAASLQGCRETVKKWTEENETEIHRASLPVGMKGKQMATRARANEQRRALQAAERTLKGIKFNKFWETVICRVTPKADANERIRARSLAKAGHHVLR
jgi:hypothetical protein